jgi:hypothetical protein
MVSGARVRKVLRAVCVSHMPENRLTPNILISATDLFCPKDRATKVISGGKTNWLRSMESKQIAEDELQDSDPIDGA